MYKRFFLIVVAGSIAMWIFVQVLLRSTDEWAETFTVENYNPADHVGKKNVATTAELVEIKQERERDQNSASELERGLDYKPTPKQAAEQNNVDNVKLPDVDAKEPSMTADSDGIIEDALAKLPVIDTAETDEMEEISIVEDGNYEMSEPIRTDSDADMQAIRNNTVAGTELSKNSQVMAMKPDLKVFDSVNINEITRKEIKIKDETIRAVDLAHITPKDSNCVRPDEIHPRIGVHYRPTSFAIKGRSLTNIDKLIELYQKCGGKMLIFDNKVETEGSDEHLIQLRQDEVKYYLLQRRVPKDDIVFSEN